MAYGEPTGFRKVRLWSGQMGGYYATKSDATKEARKYAEERGWDEVAIWQVAGKEMVYVPAKRRGRGR